jgi:hypothetical protein
VIQSVSLDTKEVVATLILMVNYFRTNLRFNISRKMSVTSA